MGGGRTNESPRIPRYREGRAMVHIIKLTFKFPLQSLTLILNMLKDHGLLLQEACIRKSKACYMKSGA